MALHLAVVILFQLHTSCVLHAPGRCVPQIVSFLQKYVTPEVYELLNRYQALVMKQLTKKPSSEDEECGEENVGCLLAEGLIEIKNIAIKPKKNGTE